MPCDVAIPLMVTNEPEEIAAPACELVRNDSLYLEIFYGCL